MKIEKNYKTVAKEVLVWGIVGVNLVATAGVTAGFMSLADEGKKVTAIYHNHIDHARDLSKPFTYRYPNDGPLYRAQISEGRRVLLEGDDGQENLTCVIKISAEVIEGEYQRPYNAILYYAFRLLGHIDKKTLEEGAVEWDWQIDPRKVKGCETVPVRPGGVISGPVLLPSPRPPSRQGLEA